MIGDRVVHAVPGMERAVVRRGPGYKQVDDLDLTVDAENLAPALTGDEAAQHAFSPRHYVDQPGVNWPPMLLARAGKDYAPLNAGLDGFVASALSQNLPVEVLNHPTGQHGFDVRDADARSRYIIRQTLAFLCEHLLPV